MQDSELGRRGSDVLDLNSRCIDANARGLSPVGNSAQMVVERVPCLRRGGPGDDRRDRDDRANPDHQKPFSPSLREANVRPPESGKPAPSHHPRPDQNGRESPGQRQRNTGDGGCQAKNLGRKDQPTASQKGSAQERMSGASVDRTGAQGKPHTKEGQDG